MRISQYIKKKIADFVSSIPELKYSQATLDEAREIKQLVAKSLLDSRIYKEKLKNIQEAEFKVYSQFGEDGIIQYLIKNAKIKENEKSFIEIGVENYRESNTRFLLINNNWSGLIVDSSPKYIDTIKKEEIYWRYDLTAACEFVSTKNINGLASKNNFPEEVGLFSLDIDGNDYWVLKSLDQIKPIIIIVEYNSIFGFKKSLTIPYNSKFNRTRAHWSNLYFGASLKAFYDLAKKKGYAFVGTNSAGNNAFFVRKDRIGKIKQASLSAGYTLSKFRESRDKSGKLTFARGPERLDAIRGMPLLNLDTGKLIKITPSILA
jgi:hypothetical protein